MVSFTKFAIHLALMSQYLLARYMNLLNDRQALVSPTHPPIDFRMLCVLKWMYNDRLHEATEHPTAHVQKVFTEVLRQAGAAV